MVQIPLRRAHRLRAITLASPIKKLRPQPTERAPTAWHTNDEYKNAEASDEASASSTVANVSENSVLPIPNPLTINETNTASKLFSWVLSRPRDPSTPNSFAAGGVRMKTKRPFWWAHSDENWSRTGIERRASPTFAPIFKIVGDEFQDDSQDCTCETS
jgi:hypothetical protein